MSPSKFQDSDVTKGLISSGTSPVPLRINRDSHTIHKPAAAAADGYSPGPKHQNPGSKRQPVIIYTHSPKIIHAQARDFMALVQKLTGMTRSDDENTVKSESKDSTSDEKDSGMKALGYDENESSSVVTDENFIGCGEMKQDSCAVSPMYPNPNPNLNPNSYLMEPPLFNGNSNEYFCSSRPSIGINNTMSPAFMDYMKGFTEY